MIISTSKKAYHDDFENLLTDCQDALCSLAEEATPYLLTRKGTKFEDDLYQQMIIHAKGTLFEDSIQIISGQKFPDIVGWLNKNRGYGVEVKTSVQNHWKTTGNSIFEGTRVDNIDRIYLFFGKLVDPIEFRYRRYEECLYDVAVTHSPRYLIDMEIDMEDTIFTKIGMPYDDLRALDNPFNPIREYYKKEILKDGDDVWWSGDDPNQTSKISIVAWSNLPKNEQYKLMVDGMILFPEIFSKKQNKFNRMATWLVMTHGIVNPHLRDEFTADGRKTIIVNNKNYTVPRIFKHLEDRVKEISERLNIINEETIEYYWNTNLEMNRLEQWKTLIATNAVPMLEPFGLDVTEMITERLSG